MEEPGAGARWRGWTAERRRWQTMGGGRAGARLAPRIRVLGEGMGRAAVLVRICGGGRAGWRQPILDLALGEVITRQGVDHTHHRLETGGAAKDLERIAVDASCLDGEGLVTAITLYPCSHGRIRTAPLGARHGSRSMRERSLSMRCEESAKGGRGRMPAGVRPEIRCGYAALRYWRGPLRPARPAARRGTIRDSHVMGATLLRGGWHLSRGTQGRHLEAFGATWTRAFGSKWPQIGEGGSHPPTDARTGTA